MIQELVSIPKNRDPFITRYPPPAALHYIALHCTIYCLYYTALYCTILHYTARSSTFPHGGRRKERRKADGKRGKEGRKEERWREKVGRMVGR
jgi:hypothetical protein